jgi:hypothetical protein
MTDWSEPAASGAEVIGLFTETLVSKRKWLIGIICANTMAVMDPRLPVTQCESRVMSQFEFL